MGWVATICTFVYGVLGVRLRFERDPLDRTMQAVSSGTSMLNHTIKNEIGKIALSTENVKRMLPPRWIGRSINDRRPYAVCFFING